MSTEIVVSSALAILSLFFFLYVATKISNSKSKKPSAPPPHLPTPTPPPPSSSSSHLPKSYPIIGSTLEIIANAERFVQWTSDIIQHSPTATYPMRRMFGEHRIFTGNPVNVKHMLKTHFNNYEKGEHFRRVFFDLLGNGIVNTDGETWKFQRQVSSHEFNTKSLRKFVETVVDTELNQRLIPFLSSAAANKSVLDLQDILQRFSFDNICEIAFGYDPAYLSPSLPETQFAKAFEDGVRISGGRFGALFPIIWKLKRFFNIGSEKILKKSMSQVREFANKIIKEKKEELERNSAIESVDLLSRFLSSGHSDENFVADIVITFILAGRDTTSAALTWFFWLLHENPEVEAKILSEIHEKSERAAFEEVKDMVYTHASLCESMRLYPPIPIDGKLAVKDDVLPDGTVVRKGTTVEYHPYAMGRLEAIWGSDWPEFKPERWLEREGDGIDGKWNFVGKDPYAYPVFQAGPRICLGKDMAFLQMKRVVAGVLQRFKIVPAEDGFDPVFISYMTAKMKGGFPVRIVERSSG